MGEPDRTLKRPRGRPLGKRALLLRAVRTYPGETFTFLAQVTDLRLTTVRRLAVELRLVVVDNVESGSGKRLFPPGSIAGRRSAADEHAEDLAALLDMLDAVLPRELRELSRPEQIAAVGDLAKDALRRRRKKK